MCTTATHELCPAPITAQTHACTLNLPRPTPPTQLLDKLMKLSDAGGADRFTLGQQPSRHIDRNPATESRRTSSEQLDLVARITQAQLAAGKLVTSYGALRAEGKPAMLSARGETILVHDYEKARGVLAKAT